MCDVCGCSDTIIKDYKHSYEIKNQNIEFISKRRFCTKCNSLVYDAELDEIAANKAIELYNNTYGIPKEKIKELRNKYKLSQQLFSKAIGCAKKTLISYEKGLSIPNDNYSIILKSLIARPDTMSIIIDANKEQFTIKEYNKIKNNIKGLSGEETELSEYNGYTKLNTNKLYNMILFFAKDGVLKTKLLKEMFYTDFLYYKNYCTSITGLEYSKINLGPVPDQYETIIKEGALNKILDSKYDIINDYECCQIYNKKEFEDVFTEEEMNTMKKVKEYFKQYGSKDIADFSHKEKAFKDTKMYNKISYDYAFDINIE